MTRALIRNSSHIAIALALLARTPCAAQQVASTNERIVLEARAARAESAAARDSVAAAQRAERRAEAAALRTRLQTGDFHVGDRITLTVTGEPALSGTFTVRAGNALEVPSLPTISLRGVLRSELHDLLSREIGRYIKQPEIRVSSLVNLAVFGAVARPGFYAVAPDAPLTDVLMTAGGPTPAVDMAHSHIVREGADFMSSTQLGHYLDTNSTLDDMGVQSGDQIVIGERQHHWQAVAGVFGVLALVLPAVALFARH
jgi:protein involved in polysaccharide export with SLBB domain